MRSRCGGRGYIMVREEAERLANIWCHTLDRVGEEAPGLMCGRRALLLLRKKGLQNNRCDVRGGGDCLVAVPAAQRRYMQLRKKVRNDSCASFIPSFLFNF